MILQSIYRFRFALSRHIKYLANFQSQRTTDRRLKQLLEENLIARDKILYGVPYIYTVTKKGKRLIHATPIEEHIRIDKIQHDILVLDCLFHLQQKYGFSLHTVMTERELHSKNAFSERRHEPDFVFSMNDEFYCVEVELTPKSKQRLEKNVQSNYHNYDTQLWIVPNTQSFIQANLKEFSELYPNMMILSLEELLS